MSTVADARIDEAHRGTLADLADVLVPAAEGMPAASEAGVAGAGLDQVLAARPDLRATLEGLLAGAAGADPRAEVNRLAAEAPDAFATLALVVTGGYYLDPEVRRRIGYPGQVPNPAAPGEAEHDLRGGLLDPVLARGPLYRATPGGGGGERRNH